MPGTTRLEEGDCATTFQYFQHGKTIFRYNQTTSTLQVVETSSGEWSECTPLLTNHPNSPLRETVVSLTNHNVVVNWGDEQAMSVLGRVWHRTARIGDDIYVFAGQERDNANFINHLTRIRIVNSTAEDPDDTTTTDTLEINHIDYQTDGISCSQVTNLAGHEMVAVNNKLYVFGGVSVHNDEFNNLLYVYDPERNTWTQPQLFGDVPTPREGHSMVHYKSPSNRDLLYVFGGSDNSGLMDNEMYVLDLETMIFRRVERSDSDEEYRPTPRYYQSTVLYNDHLYVFGGYLYTRNRRPLDRLFVFSIEQDQWVTSIYIPYEMFPFGLSEHCCTVVGNYMIVNGGNSDEEDTGFATSRLVIYNFKNDMWQIPYNQPSVGRSGHTTTEIGGNGKLLLIAGAMSSDYDLEREDTDIAIVETHLDLRGTKDLVSYQNTVMNMLKSSVFDDVSFNFNE